MPAAPGMFSTGARAHEPGALQRLLHHARGLIPAAAGRRRRDDAELLDRMDRRPISRPPSALARWGRDRTSEGRGTTSGRREEVDQGARRGRLLRSGGDAGSVDRDALDLVRERPDIVDALYGKQLADLLEPDVSVATRDYGANALADDPASSSASAARRCRVEERARSRVGAARAGGIRDRSRLQQRPDERVDGADVGLWRAGAHGHTDTGSREIGSRLGDDRALLDELLQRLSRDDNHVGRLATRQPDRDRVRRAAGRRAEHGDDRVRSSRVRSGG